MKIGIGIGEISGRPVDIDGLIAQAQRAEADGFASGWLAQVFGIDAITAATVIGRHTSRMEIGTAVVPTFPRHPMAMAQQAMSAQAAASGRFALGIGLSHQMVIESMFGLSFARPYSHMREYMTVLAGLVRAGHSDHQGEEYRVNLSLRVPGATPCPILMAALAPRMLGLAGELADGTITWMTGPRTLQSHTVPRISQAAKRAGRPAPRVVVGLPIAVGTDIDAARQTAGRVFQAYGALPSYRAMMDREGVEGPADLAIVGDEADVERQLRRLADIGVTDFLAIPLPVGPDKAASAERTRALLIKLAAQWNGVSQAG